MGGEIQISHHRCSQWSFWLFWPEWVVLKSSLGAVLNLTCPLTSACNWLWEVMASSLLSSKSLVHPVLYLCTTLSRARVSGHRSPRKVEIYRIWTLLGNMSTSKPAPSFISNACDLSTLISTHHPPTPSVIGLTKITCSTPMASQVESASPEPNRSQVKSKSPGKGEEGKEKSPQVSTVHPYFHCLHLLPQNHSSLIIASNTFSTHFRHYSQSHVCNM